MSRFNPLEHPICFSHPLRLGPTAELVHVPVAMFLVDVLRPEVLIQLGVSEGTLFCAYAQAVRYLGLSTRCFAVGEWSNGDSEGTDPSHLSNLRAHHDPLYGDFSQLIQGSPGDRHTDFENAAIDLLHIRAFSPNDELAALVERWLPRMSNRGVVVLENINVRSNECNVWKVWKDLSDVHPHFEFPHQGGLGVVAVGKAIPDELVAILEATDAEASLTREFFRQSGERIKAQQPTNPEVERLKLRVTDLFLELQGKTLAIEEKERAIKSLLEDMEVADREGERSRAEMFRLSAQEEQLNNILNSRAWRWVTRYGHVKRRYLEPVFRSLRQPGVNGRRMAPRSFQVPRQIDPYEAWLEVNQWNVRREEVLRERLSLLTAPPLLSVIMPVLNTPIEFLNKTIQSVVDQVYENWELCIADDASTDPLVRSTLKQWGDKDKRIKIITRKQNGNISLASNSAAELAGGEFLVFLDQDDELTPDALGEVALFLSENQDTDILYSDDDKIDTKGNRYSPQFKPDWSPELLLSRTYLNDLFVIRRTLFDEVGGMHVGVEGSQDYDLALRITERANHIGHIPKILYHRRALSNSTAASGDADATRGFGDNRREAAGFLMKYGDKIGPYYNPNLSLDDERFAIRARTVAPENLRSIRTLMCGFNLNREGAPYSQYELTVKLKAKGVIDPIVYSPVDGPLRQAYEGHGIEVIVRGHPLTGVTSLPEYETRIEAFSRQLKDLKIDLVYGNTLQTFYAIAAAHRLDLPSIWNPRESEPWETYFDFLPREIAKPALQCFAYPYQVVFVSNASKQVWQPLNSHHNFTVIHNGLNRERFDAAFKKWPREIARALLKIPPHERAIVIIGTVCERKGQLDLVEAMGRLQHSGLTRTFIVGSCTGAYGQRVKKALRALPYSWRSRIEIVEETSDPALYYAAADVFVCCSRIESFPRVILEALAAGVPIITTPVFGIAEQVQEGISALFYQPGDIQGLAQALSAIIEDDELRKRLADNTGPALNSLIDFDSMADAYGQVFREAWLSGCSRD